MMISVPEKEMSRIFGFIPQYQTNYINLNRIYRGIVGNFLSQTLIV